MPSRNVIKIDIPNTYYHIYARGHSKVDIYRDDEDYRVFLNLIKRYLGRRTQKNSCGRLYDNFRGEIELICYCLMPNHFHFLIYQIEPGVMSKLMRCINTSYSRYFNKKYSSSGAIFETVYKASIIDRDQYILHISRYIHRNPKKWLGYSYSSLPYYLNHKTPDWLMVHRVIDLFTSINEYLVFLTDYDSLKKPDKNTQ